METTKNITRKLQGAYITTVVSITLVLFLLGLTGIILLNTKKFTNYLRENIGFTVFLTDSISNKQALRVQDFLQKKTYVKESSYVSKEQAARELKEDLGEDFENILGENPLSHSFKIIVNENYANADSIQLIKQELEKLTEVKEVVYQRPLIDVLQKNLQKISIITSVFAIILLIVSIFLINNTIRLSIHSQRFIIRTLQLVGATSAFISKPFILKSIMNGIIGGILSTWLLVAIVYLAPEDINTIFSLEDIGLLLFSLLFLGILISALAAWRSVHKYMRMEVDQLYN